MNDSEKNMVAFRDSRKGFDKGDVNRYIEEMSIRFTAQEAALRNRIRELENQLPACEPEEAENDYQAEIARLGEENRELRAELEKLSKKTEEETAPAADENQLPCDPNYQQISEKLGNILLKANLDADRIVSEAEGEAARQLSEAEKSADGIRLDAAVSARLMTAKVKAKLAGLAEEYIRNLTALSEESAAEYAKLCAELQIKASALAVRPDEILQSLK